MPAVTASAFATSALIVAAPAAEVARHRVSGLQRLCWRRLLVELEALPSVLRASARSLTCLSVFWPRRRSSSCFLFLPASGPQPRDTSCFPQTVAVRST